MIKAWYIRLVWKPQWKASGSKQAYFSSAWFFCASILTGKSVLYSTGSCRNLIGIFKLCTVKTNALKKPCCSVNLEKNNIFLDIFMFKIFRLYRDTGSNIFFRKLSVGHRASSISFSMICAVSTYKKKMFPDRCFSLKLFWKHIF